jgi:hypothetical protein
VHARRTHSPASPSTPLDPTKGSSWPTHGSRLLPKHSAVPRSDSLRPCTAHCWPALRRASPTRTTRRPSPNSDWHRM